MSKLLVAPTEAVDSTMSLAPINLAKEDPELFEFQIKVGTLQTSLYQPPFIQTNTVTVNYDY